MVLPRRPAWAGRNFTLLTSAGVLSTLGSSGALIASAFAVLGAGGSGTDVGLVVAARTVPLVLFLLVGGAIADRLPRQKVMVAANALNFLSQGVLALLVLGGAPAVWQMALLSALGGTGQAFFAPAASGMLLATVPEEDSGRAFAFYRMGTNGAGILGTALGGALVAAVGPGWVLAVDAVAFAVCGALRAFLDVRHLPPRTGGGGMWHDLREGWREVAGRPWLWSVVAQFAVVNAVIAAAEAVYGPLVARDRLGGAGPWGVALAAFGVGTLLGGVVMTRFAPRRVLFVGVLCVLPLALPSAALALGVSAVWLTVVMLLTGVSLEVFGVTWMTALHQEIPEEKFSRVTAYDYLGSTALIPVATALAGPVQDRVGLSAALWGCSGLVVLLTVAVLCVPDVRGLRRRTVAVSAAAAGGVPLPLTGPVPPTAESPPGPADAAEERRADPV